ncbi:NifB/NifX family molybdenum-iron cluster-binding protein [Vibrio hippocampi]|uniref:Dinitrogenase iron-molybdenum cofactor biosynthesis domain-containing protein n=1 Tax=Vibrio hippocampi TaxID=654686 RepID=A0ABM8ZLI6_9VIBR|nr:NifB/NifX family molybdenum-iron cluster-binding protein [Vibrio hippocampi]CAH0529273.1 hypothetical protein VHP8226_03137 [Vibrio hippocampi]
MVVRKLHVESDDNQFTAIARVAFATADRVHVDQHFGQTKSLVIYEVNKESHHLVDAIDFVSGEQRGHQHLADKIKMLEDCDAVYCNACGVSALRQLLAQDTYPIKVEQGMAIKVCLATLHHELSMGSVRWIKSSNKKSAVKSESRSDLDLLLDEPWNQTE